MYTIYSVNDPIFDKLPNLTKVMLLQTWIAAPSVRNSLQILDPLNINNMPEPLLSVDIAEGRVANKGAYEW